MSEPELPELSEDQRKKEEERRGAGAFWSGGAPSAGSAGGSAGQAAAGGRLAGFGRSILQRVFGEPVAWLKHVASLGPRGALVPLRQMAVKGLVALIGAYSFGHVIEWGVERSLPARGQRTIAGAAFGGRTRSSPLPKDALPAEGLFGLLPGVFTNKKGFLAGGSPAPDASLLKEGKSPDGVEPAAAAGDAVSQEDAAGGAGGGGAEASDPEADRWAEALAGAQGAGASEGFEKLPGLAGSSSGRASAGGVAGGSKGRPRGGAGGGITAAGAGSLTAFKRGAPMRSMLAGRRTNRALPQENNVRQRLVGATIMSNEAARITGSEASFTHAAAAWDQGALGAQAIGDPAGLRSNPAVGGGAGGGGGGGGGGGVRPNASGWTGGNPVPFDVSKGNANILRPDLGIIPDTVELPPDIPQGKNDTLYIRLVEDARQLISDSKSNKTKGRGMVIAGQIMEGAGYTMIVGCALAGPGVCAAAKKLILGGAALIAGGKLLQAFAQRQADEAEDIAREIEYKWDANENADALDYCIAQARREEGCTFKGDWTRAQVCGYRPQMVTEQLRVFSLCMSEKGPGLPRPTEFYPEAEYDPADPNKICRLIYPDAVTRPNNDPQRPYKCVRPP